jgi:hypothetical protein
MKPVQTNEAHQYAPNPCLAYLRNLVPSAEQETQRAKLRNGLL